MAVPAPCSNPQTLPGISTTAGTTGPRVTVCALCASDAAVVESPWRRVVHGALSQVSSG